MNRLSASDRAAMIPSPRCMSSRQSSGGGSRLRIISRLPAIDLIGVSELFSSWPSTRTSRCQACSSSSRNGRVRSLITSNWCGSPPSRNIVRDTPQRPLPPGNARCTVRFSSPVRNCARSSDSASAFSSRSEGRLSSRSPARFTSCKRWALSKANTETSISSITLRSRVVASSAPRRWARSVAPMAFTCSITSPSASSSWGRSGPDRVVALAHRFEKVGQRPQR